MFEKFERRGWLYWIVLVYMSLETAYNSFSRLPPLVDLLGPSGETLWNITPDFHRSVLIYGWVSTFAAVLFVVFFANGVKFSYYIMLFIALLLLPYGVIKYHLMPDLALLSDREASRAVGRFVGGLVGGLLQILLLVWVTRKVCFRPTRGPIPLEDEESALTRSRSNSEKQQKSGRKSENAPNSDV